jgi:hypothetical protein
MSPKSVAFRMASSNSCICRDRQYKARIRQWGLEKKVKSNEMLIIIGMDKKRKMEEGKNTAFFVRKRRVDPRKISRFIKNHDIPDGHYQISRKYFRPYCQHVP